MTQFNKSDRIGLHLQIDSIQFDLYLYSESLVNQFLKVLAENGPKTHKYKANGIGPSLFRRKNPRKTRKPKTLSAASLWSILSTDTLLVQNGGKHSCSKMSENPHCCLLLGRHHNLSNGQVASIDSQKNFSTSCYFVHELTICLL